MSSVSDILERRRPRIVLKVDEVIRLLRDIAIGPTEVALDAYITYVKLSLEDVKLCINISPEVEAKFIEKARKIWLLFGKSRTKVEYPPELRYLVVPHFFGQRKPMIAWKQDISEEKREKLVAYVSSCGQVLTASFRTCHRVPFLDFDVESAPSGFSEKLRQVLTDLTKSLAVPIKYTWHGGVHCYIPVDASSYPHGVVAEQDGDTLCDRARAFYLVDHFRGITVRVELLLDVITVHPLQSWLWVELDETDTPSDVHFQMCAIPNNHPSVNFFLYGISYRFRDPDAVLRQLVDEVCSRLRLERHGPSVPKLVAATEELLQRGQRLGVSSPFRSGGRDTRHPIVLTDNAFIVVTRPDLSMDEFFKFLEELRSRGLLQNCLTYFLLDPEPWPDVIKHWVFIVAWFLLQQYRVFVEEPDITDYVGPRVSKLHRLRRVRLYYYRYYSNCYFDERLRKIVYPRPFTVPQLREALLYILGTTLCRTCPYYMFCRLESLSASRKLMISVNLQILEICWSHHDLLDYLDVNVIYRAYYRRLWQPLPRSLQSSTLGEEATSRGRSS